MKDKDLTETKAQGYKVENGKLVYFSNMLNGYKHEYKGLQDICEEMNGLLKKFDSYEEQLAFWKGKAEEKLPKGSIFLTKKEIDNLWVCSGNKYTVLDKAREVASKQTAQDIIKKLEQLQICVRGIGLNDLIILLKKEYEL